MSNRDLTPFLDARQNQLQLEMAAGDAVDTKSLAVLASDFTVLLFIAQSTTIKLQSAPVKIVLALLVVALLLTCITIRPRKYAGASTNIFDHPEYLSFTTNKLVKQLISDTEAAILKNKGINGKRWKFCLAALILTLIALATLLIVLYCS